MEDFEIALNDVCSAWPALMPPTRRRVSESAAKFLMIKRPGGASGFWNPEETPYMVEPVDMLASRRHSAVCFVGGAQKGKTVALGEGWMTHAVISDPGDMLIVQMTQDKAREYSRQRIDRAIRNSPALKAMKTAKASDDNLHDKSFRNGMILRIAWPTVTNLSSTSYRYVFGTDYDRWPHNIDGEGDGFTLMGKRVTTFLSRGMVAVESSPGYPATDPTWKPATPHEAPPVGTEETGGGILAIYNRGDRRRWYWPCPHCGEWFEAKPGLDLFRLPAEDELLERIRDLDIDAFARQYARVICPNTGCLIEPTHKQWMNLRGRWLADGQTIDADGVVHGTPRRSTIASFWLGGVAAAYVSWETLIAKQLQALLDYASSGNELPLMTTANTDQGIPYMSRALRDAAADAARGRRVEHDLQRYVVPEWTRYVVAMVDVQGGKRARFEVQFHAVGEGQRRQLIDRRAIRWSKRPGLGTEFAPIDPGRYPEDWDVLTEQVVDATFRTPTEGVEIRVLRTACDLGGEDGVTANAYAWWRRLRAAGKHRRVRLTKGDTGKKLPWMIKESMGGGKAGAGDVPFLLLNTHGLKDIVDNCLKRETVGPGYYHFPEPKHPDRNPDGWLPEAFFDELKAEVRNDDGTWSQIKPRNESLDLCVMEVALGFWLGVDKRGFWDNPPRWARPLDDGNSEIVTREERREERAVEADHAEPAVVEQRPARAPLKRRVTRSSYLG